MPDRIANGRRGPHRRRAHAAWRLVCEPVRAKRRIAATLAALAAVVAAGCSLGDDSSNRPPQLGPSSDSDKAPEKSDKK